MHFGRGVGVIVFQRALHFCLLITDEMEKKKKLRPEKNVGVVNRALLIYSGVGL